MAVFVTGDIHGNPTRLSKDNFYEQKDFSGNKDENIVIILGDFGLVWNRDGESKQEKYWLNWLNQKPFTTVFVDGNHECFPRIYSYPVKEWRGGKVHEVRSNVLHLMRGEVFSIEDKKFLITMTKIGENKLKNLISKVNICIVSKICLGGKKNYQQMMKCNMD